ncbi:MAG: YadA-like family protein [Sterolibacterium sp.]|nr:YadA-like family protein [Sterolibacterium sp.]
MAPKLIVVVLAGLFTATAAWAQQVATDASAGVAGSSLENDGAGQTAMALGDGAGNAGQLTVQNADGTDLTQIEPNGITIIDTTNDTTTTIDQNGYNVQKSGSSASISSNGNITASGSLTSATLNVGPATPATGSAVVQVGTTAGKTTLGVQNLGGTVNGIASGTSSTTLRGGTLGQTTLKLDDTGVSFAAFGVAPVRVHGVADGAAPTDAVNKRQLDALSSQVDQFDGRISTLENRVDKMDKRMSAGIASTMAAVNIPQVDGDKTFALGVGLGSYNSESALAVGASYRMAPDAVLKASVASGSGSGSKAAFGVGAALSW